MGKLKVKIAVLILLSSFCICHFVFAQDKIVGIVNNDIITQKDLNDFLNFMRMQLSEEYSGKELETKIQDMKLDLINKLIDDRLILQEAKRYKVIVDESRVKARLDEIRRHYRTDAEFQNSLRQQGLVLSDLEKKIREQFLMFNMIEYKIRSKVTVTPLEVTEFYQKNEKEFDLGEERFFSSMNTEEEIVAKKAFGDLKKGEPFDSVANKYGMPLNELVASRSGKLRKEIEETIFKLMPQEISEPVKIYDSYYIFKLDSITPPRKLTLDEAKEQIFSYLQNSKMESELSTWLAELRKHSYIKLVQD